MEIRKLDGSLYDKEISGNEERFLSALADDGFSFRLVKNVHYQPYYRIEKDGTKLDFKIYTDPKVKVADQLMFFQMLFDMTSKVKEMEVRL